MKTSHLLLPLLALSCASLLHAGTPGIPQSFQRDAAPFPSKVSENLLWIADTHKMDAFLATFQVADVRYGSYAGEVLPDTRVAWRDYALEAIAFAKQGQQGKAAEKLAQMIKLAAVYSSFGGLQNVVQGEEIRHLAGLTAQKLGKTVTALIQSPYLEKDAGDVLIALEAKAGSEKSRVTPSFWRNLEKQAVATHNRLASGTVVASAP